MPCKYDPWFHYFYGHPDEGIYARIRELENWKDSATKIIWITATAMVGLGAATVWNQIISGG